MTNDTKIAGRTALITGASSGIGYELTRLFARDGHTVVLVARDVARRTQVAADLRRTFKVSVTAIPKDLAQPAAAEELFRDLLGLYDTCQTNTHFALSPLALVDEVVRAAVSDDFTLGPAARRWLEEDEFHVRARMRRDVADGGKR